MFILINIAIRIQENNQCAAVRVIVWMTQESVQQQAHFQKYNKETDQTEWFVTHLKTLSYMTQPG